MQQIITQGLGTWPMIAPQGYGATHDTLLPPSKVGGGAIVTKAQGYATASGTKGSGNIILVEYRAEGHVEDD